LTHYESDASLLSTSAMGRMLAGARKGITPVDKRQSRKRFYM